MTMKKASTTALLFLIVIIGVIRAFEERCGDCWCIPDSGGTGDCPVFEGGYYDVPLPQTVTDAYRSFNLVNTDDAPKLQAQDGSTVCSPYTHLTALQSLPQSQLPPCALPPMADVDSAVCAFVFPNELVSQDDECSGRDYEMRTYETSTDALSAGGVVTHIGACGVCSNANDLAVIASNPDLDKVGTKCGTQFYISTVYAKQDPADAFEDLVKCYEGEAGYTPDCARLWAHDSAAVGTLCLASCQLSAPYNGEAPLCELSDCLQCKEDNTGAQLRAFAGRTHINSGLTQKVAHPCADFASVVHDPCDGFAPEDLKPVGVDIPSATVPPIPIGSSTSSATHSYYPLVLLFSVVAGAISILTW